MTTKKQGRVRKRKPLKQQGVVKNVSESKKFAKPLTPKQLRFCEEYLTDHNATQAYIRAGYSKNGAEVSACQLLRNTKVAEFIEKADEKVNQGLLKKHEVTAEAIIQELAACGFSVLTDFAEWSSSGVTIKNSKEVDARAVKSIKKDKDGNITFTLHGKVESLKELAEIAGMKVKKVETKDVTDSIPSDDDIRAAEKDIKECEKRLLHGEGRKKKIIPSKTKGKEGAGPDLVH